MNTPGIATYAPTGAASTRVSHRMGEVLPFILAPAAVEVAGEYPAKRVLDAVLAGSALILLAAFMAMIWVVVCVSSGGPGLFWSQRVGRDGRVFWMPKYRTMTVGAPLSPREMLKDPEVHITPVGAWLRRSALDELPQLYSILMGHMSFIGPRPLLPNDPAVAARRRYPAAMAARPGLSGLAQVVGRNAVTPGRKARLDAFYARASSLTLDARIFWRTAGVVLTSRGFL